MIDTWRMESPANKNVTLRLLETGSQVLYARRR